MVHSTGAPGFVASALVAMTCLVGCGLVTPFAISSDPPRTPDGGPSPDADAVSDAGHDALDGDADPSDADIPEGPGPLTFVATSFSFVLDRLCDLDGDGVDNNAMADLGSPAGEVLAMAINAEVRDTATLTELLLFHLPFVDDRAGPDLDDGIVIFAMGRDTDVPPNPDDDLSGVEPLYADHFTLDPCGEPTTYLQGVQLRGGVITRSSGPTVIEFADFVPLYTTELHGEIEPGGGAATFITCSYATIDDLGAFVDTGAAGDLNGLEVFVAGGARVGMPSVPGLTPDVDLDGDGLEGFALDASYHIASCIDGDHTVIEGRDCWQDERMADGISLMASMEAISAGFAGLVPSWEDLVEGTCEAPPERSLWTPRGG